MRTRVEYKDLLDSVIVLAAMDRNGSYIPLEGTSLSSKFAAVERHFEKGKIHTAVVSSDQPKKDLPNEPPYRLIRAIDFDDLIEKIKTTPRPDRKVQDSRMPTTPGDKLFGRVRELKMLDEAWSNGKTNVLTFVAMGGTGKTALINHWLDDMRGNDWRGAENVYTWSFYSQGAAEDRQASADPFFDHALRWFGYDGDPITSAWERGLKLAELVAGNRTLLILDGLEPLQYPPGEMQDRLKDQGLQALLRQLSSVNQGLCLITTRTTVAELEGRKQDAVISHDLGNLQTEDGVLLLRHLGVKSVDREREEEELRKAVIDFGGHALALNLLGSYIVTVHGGDIINRYREPNLQKEVPGLGGHAERVMASYERWLAETNKAELAILYIMGLFDRPAPAGAIKALREKPAILELTDLISDIGQSEWQFALKHLRTLHLLNPADEYDDCSLDAHPLVREFFGGRLKSRNREVWYQAHERLYEYYKKISNHLKPNGTVKIDTFLQVVLHGCESQHFSKSLKHYLETFNEGVPFRVEKEYGSWGLTLSAMSHFFIRTWDKTYSSLCVDDSAEIMNIVGMCHRALGRPVEAENALQIGLKKRLSSENWKEATVESSNLGEIQLQVGRINDSIYTTQQGISCAKKTDDLFWNIVCHGTYAEALHNAGCLHESENIFKEIEPLQKQIRPQYDFLYSIRGVAYCDVLASLAQFAEIKRRGKFIAELSNKNKWPLDEALAKITLGIAYGSKPQNPRDIDTALKYTSEGLILLHVAGALDYFPKCLIIKSALFRVLKNSSAIENLCEAYSIAQRSRMFLYITDCHLEAARLALTMGRSDEKIVLDETEDHPPATAEDHIKIASNLIDKTGYGRRKPDLALIWARLAIAKGEWEEASRQLDIATQYVDDGWKIHEVELKELTEIIQKS